MSQSNHFFLFDPLRILQHVTEGCIHLYVSMSHKCRVWVASDSPDSKVCRQAIDAIQTCPSFRMLGPWTTNGLPASMYLDIAYVKERLRDCVDVLVCVFNDDYEAHHEWLHALGGMAYVMDMPVLVYADTGRYTPYATETFWHGDLDALVKRLKQCKPHLPQIGLPRKEGWYEECINNDVGGWWHVTHSTDPPPDASPQGLKKRIKSSN